MTDIEPLHRIAYEHGAEPIEHAVETIATFIETREDIVTTRAVNPLSCPGYGSDTSAEHFARRILGELLAAGWEPPSPEAVAAAAEQSRREGEEIDRTKHLPCRCGHGFTAHLGPPGGSCVDCLEPAECWRWAPEPVQEGE